MSTKILEYSDYEIQSIAFFIDKIEEKLALRDLNGLSNGNADLINVSKQHPLAQLMASQINPNTRSDDLFRSGLLPAISVTPGGINDGGFTIGQSYKPKIVDAGFMAPYIALSGESNKTIQESGLITQNQLDTLISEYNRATAGSLRVQQHEWRKDEEINISAWSESADIDILIGVLLDSIIGSIAVGTVGDSSPIKNLRYKIVKGLINFNFGRTLYGSEYNLTFTNTYNNFEIYSDDVISDHETDFTHVIPGE